MHHERADYRVVYVGTGRQQKGGLLGLIGRSEPERTWRERIAVEMEGVCQEMGRRGLGLIQVVPVLSTISLQGSWTEGVWLVFGGAAPPSQPPGIQTHA